MRAANLGKKLIHTSPNVTVNTVLFMVTSLMYGWMGMDGTTDTTTGSSLSYKYHK